MTQLIDSSNRIIEPTDWLPTLYVKTLQAIRPSHDNGSVPDVNLLFTDGSAFLLSVKPGVYFEGCLINTLRKAQPIANVLAVTGGDGDWCVEIRSLTFPLIMLLARNKDLPHDEFPFELKVRESPRG